MREVERLYGLQELDDQVAAQEGRLRDWAGRRRAVQESLSQARAARDEQEKALQERERHLHRMERSLRELEGRLKELEGRLYSETIRSAKEAAALQTEIEQARKQKGAVEDEALQCMLDLDEQRARLQRLREEERAHAQEQEALGEKAGAEETILREQIARLGQARDGLVAEITPAARSLYEQIRRTRGGKAVSRVKDNTCAVCRLEVAVLTRKAALGDALVRCENCGCILYLP